ncbi:hypothetical protein GCM10011368_25780 [Hyunsoonleella pacifica]|nr:hypothetical protein GCM10011368_25780 [Hyunsoonleella pacifica]
MCLLKRYQLKQPKIKALSKYEKIGLSIFAIVIAFVLTTMSSSSYNLLKISLIVFIAILLGALTISIFIMVWSPKNWKSTFLQSFNISFGLSALLFICGYLFTALHPIILK